MKSVRNLGGLFLLVFCSYCSVSNKSQDFQGISLGKVLYKDNFERLKNHWIIETPKHPNSRVFVSDSKLVIDVAAGATIWFDKKLSGNYLVSYKRTVVMKNEVNDRLSDLNQFWMASDPKNQDLFRRTGVFEEYDSLRLYYVGMGGNTNNTTRLRKYLGDGSKPLLKEYTDKEHLLLANKQYHITLIVRNGLSELFVDGKKFFSYQDTQPLTEGYFGFRTTASRQEIEDFKIFALK